MNNLLVGHDAWKTWTPCQDPNELPERECENRECNNWHYNESGYCDNCAEVTCDCGDVWLRDESVEIDGKRYCYVGYGKNREVCECVEINKD